MANIYISYQKLKQIVNRENRFYGNKSTVLDLLYENDAIYSTQIPAGREFFRGRIFDVDDVTSTYGKYHNWVDSDDGIFQGYGKSESGAPPAKFATEGRLNVKGIPFLYTCNNVDTVIHELRPTREEYISVAKFITKKDLKFADLTIFKSDRIKNADLSDLIMFIANDFSTPHYTGHSYAFTQYLAGQFMNMGFDGIIFESSLNPSGENYVFFYTNDCEAVSSHLYMACEFHVDYKSISRKDIK